MRKSASAYDTVTALLIHSGHTDAENASSNERFAAAMQHIMRAPKQETQPPPIHIPLKHWPKQRRQVIGFATSDAVSKKWRKFTREGWTKVWFIQTREGKDSWVTWNGGEKAYVCRTTARRDALSLHADGDGPDTRIVRWTHQKRKDMQWLYLRIRIFRITQRNKEQKFNSLPEEIREWRTAQRKLLEVKTYLNRWRSRMAASKQEPISRTS